MSKSNTAKRQQQAAKSAARQLNKVIDWKALFPRGTTSTGKPDMRRKLSRYQIKKIKDARSDFFNQGGFNNFHPARRSKALALKKSISGTRDIFKGYLSPLDLDVKEKEGGIQKFTGSFESFGLRRTESYIILQFENAPMTVEQLKVEFRKVVGAMEQDALVVGMYNNSASYMLYHISSMDGMLDAAAKDFEKYAEMAEAGQMRGRKADHGDTLAAHPSEWMRGITYHDGNNFENWSKEKLAEMTAARKAAIKARRVAA